MEYFPQIVILVTFLLFVFFVISGKLKIHVAAMMIPIILEATGILDFNEAWGGLLSNNIIMMCSMFLVGAAVSKTDILTKVCGVFIKPNASDIQIVVGLVIPWFLINLVVNGTASAMIMIPMITSVCATHKRPLSKIVAPVMIGSMAFGGLIPIGGAAAGYLTQNRIIEALGGAGGFTFWTNTLVKLPLAIAMFLIAVFVMTKMAPDNGNIPDLEMGMEAEEKANAAIAKHKSKLTPKQDKLVKIIFVGTIIGIVACSFTTIGTWIPSTIGAFLIMLSGALTDREAMQSFNNPVLFIFIGTLPLATALNKTGTDIMISDAFQRFTAGMSPFFIMFFMYMITCILTQFLTNSAVNNIFRMLAALIAVQSGFSPVALMLAVSNGTANSYLMPTASPVATLMYDAGGYTPKQWFILGLPVTIASIIIFMVWVPFMWPLV